MTTFKVLLIENNGSSHRTTIQAKDSYTANKLAQSMYTGFRSVQITGWI